MSPGRRALLGRGEIVADRVQDRPDAEVAQGRTAEHGYEPPGERRLTDGAPERVGRDGRVAEVKVREPVDGFRRALNQPVPGRCGGRGGCHRNLPGFLLTAPGSRIEHDPLHREQVDHAVEPVFQAVRQVYERGPGPETLLDISEHPLGFRPRPIELVDEGDARHAVAVRLMPHGLALRLHTFDPGEDHDRSVEHPEAALHLGREVDVAGGVDQVDLVVVPEEGRRRR